MIKEKYVILQDILLINMKIINSINKAQLERKW